MQEDAELVRLWENQKISLENLVRRQHQAMTNMRKILADSEEMHGKMVLELEEEKAKNVTTKGTLMIRDCRQIILSSIYLKS